VTPAAASVLRLHLSCASEAWQREACARGIDQTQLFELQQRLRRLRSAAAGGLPERGCVDMARVARQTEEGMQDAVCGVSRHDSSISWD
jgi:hypothetical protein